MSSARVNREIYDIPEMAGRKPIRILFKDSDFLVAKGFWMGVGYDIEYHYRYFGDLMRSKKDGFDVGVYYRVPFITKRYIRESELLFQRGYKDKVYQHARLLPLESNFVFRMAESAYRFAEGRLTLRDMMDLYMFYEKWKDQMDEKIVVRGIKRFKTDQMAFDLLHLAHHWFQNPQEDLFGYRQPEKDKRRKIEENILRKGYEDMLSLEDCVQYSRLKKEIESSEGITYYYDNESFSDRMDYHIYGKGAAKAA